MVSAADRLTAFEELPDGAVSVISERIQHLRGQIFPGHCRAGGCLRTAFRLLSFLSAFGRTGPDAAGDHADSGLKFKIAVAVPAERSAVDGLDLDRLGRLVDRDGVLCVKITGRGIHQDQIGRCPVGVSHRIVSDQRQLPLHDRDRPRLVPGLCERLGRDVIEGSCLPNGGDRVHLHSVILDGGNDKSACIIRHGTAPWSGVRYGAVIQLVDGAVCLCPLEFLFRLFPVFLRHAVPDPPGDLILALSVYGRVRAAGHKAAEQRLVPGAVRPEGFPLAINFDRLQGMRKDQPGLSKSGILLDTLIRVIDPDRSQGRQLVASQPAEIRASPALDPHSKVLQRRERAHQLCFMVPVLAE